MEVQTIEEGLNLILVETTQILNSLEETYIIIGGWSPFLLNSNEIIKHPGTKDVDVLLKNGTEKGRLRDMFLSFIDKGFLFSAKNQFQMIKTYTIEGKTFAYNVDFIHPKITNDDDEIYVDHLDIGIPIDKYRSRSFMMMSIATPNALGLFDGHFVNFTYNFNGLNVTFPLMNETGLLLTKSESVRVQKRKRDSLDIFMAIKNCRCYEKMINDLKRIRENNTPLYNTLYGIREAFEKKYIIKNILKYYNNNEDIESTLEKFISDSLLNLKAENNEPKYI